MSDEAGASASDEGPGDVPPAWVALSDLRSWLVKLYGPQEAVRYGLLVADVRDRASPRHRVAGWIAAKRQWEVGRAFPPGYTERRWPIGLDQGQQGDLVVHDWDIRQFDVADGTIVGLHGRRVAIEVRWKDVTGWMAGNLPKPTPLRADDGRRPFEFEEARAIVFAQKVKGRFAGRDAPEKAPMQVEVARLIDENFHSASRAQKRALWKQYWPDVRPGPRRGSKHRG